MLKRLPLLVAGLLLHTTMAQAQSASTTRAQQAPLVRTLFIDSINIRHPTVSPDERWLVFVAVISNQETRLMIQPLAGGSPRELFAAKGHHGYPRFVPAGDRLVFNSSVHRRSPNDNAVYLVSAQFDTRSGTLLGPPRQISLEGVNRSGFLNPAISPDGRSIAYVGTESKAIKVIPLTGGTARTLVEPSTFPMSLAWSPDGRSLSYELSEGPEFVRMRVGLDGNAPIEVVRSSERLGPLSPDGRYSFAISFRGASGPSNLRWFDVNGRLLGESKLPPYVSVIANVGASGKYIPVWSSVLLASVKVVSVKGGPSRQVTAGTSWDDASGWSSDGLVQVLTGDQGHAALAQYTISGELKSKVRLPDDIRLERVVRIRDGQLIYQGEVNTPERSRLMSMSLKDGSRKDLLQNVLLSGDPIGPGGGNDFVADGEFYYQQLRGSRVQLYALQLGATSRLIGEIPTSALGRAAVFQNRIIYRQPVKDSIRLQLVGGPGQLPKTLGTFGADPYIEFAWSHDGRQLAVSAGTPQELLIISFDADGSVQGSPRAFVLPFDGWWGAIWLHDGSGLTMIAMPRGSTVREVAVVNLADPQNPILLTKDDPGSQDAFVLSPDGKFVAYPARVPARTSTYMGSGSSVHLIDVAQLLKQFPLRK